MTAPGRCLAALCTFVALATAAAVAPLPAGATQARTSLPAIERQVMCVTCKIPLNVAQSPQSQREREYVQSLIDLGDTEAQIKRALVSQYGAAVLALPATHGFDLAAYLVPPAVLVALAATLAVLLPRWRRRAPAHQTAAGAPEASAQPPPLSPADAARLDADLASFD